MPRKFPFRTLIAFYILAMTAAACEFFAGSGNTDDSPARDEDPAGGFPILMWRLYPRSAASEYLMGRWHEEAAPRRIEHDDRLSLSQAIVEFTAESREAANHYERAIKMGLRSDEDLAYRYALTLIRGQADPNQIDQAIANWRRNFPYSKRQNPKRN